MSGTDISLCMIVRDEAETLARCLESARSLVAQVVVVYTGSTDGTAELAKSYGAEVYSFEWNDDFSAARNASLERATCDWILVLDADEVVEETSAPDLDKVLADISVAGARVLITNLSTRGPDQLFTVVRLFRNVPAIRYQFPVHEEVSFSLLRYALEKGKRIVESPLRIIHYGYLPEYVTRKGERNLRLLRRELKRAPDDLYCRIKEYEELDKLGRLEECSARVDEAFAVARRLPIVKVAGFNHSPLLLANYSQVKLDAGEADRALKAAEWGLEMFPGDPLMLFYRALSLLRQGGFGAARRAFSRCLELEIKSGDYYVEPGIASWLSLFHRAEAYLALGDADAARRDLESCRKAKPDFTDALRLLVEAHLRLGNPESAMKSCIELLRCNEDDLWALVNGAAIMKRLGMRDRACTWLKRALKIKPYLAEAKEMLSSLEAE